ncbi:MAG: GNAT family N-acetyltransferase [Proteobacteria bacterium]|nr:GNAT family N-acetyltransferase [Pseudomonadota bacterium]
MSIALFPAGLDTAPLAAIHAQCFPDAWSAKAIADLLTMPGTFAFAAPEGFALARAAGGEAEILTLAVLPEARRYGIGSTLVSEAASHAAKLGAQTLFLEVAAGNLAARTLYRRLGLTETATRKGYYTAGRQTPEDALILSSALPLSPLGKSPPAG